MKQYNELLSSLSAQGSLRSLPEVEHDGRWIYKDGKRMLNLSSNDYLGLAVRKELQEEFLSEHSRRELPFSSSSSRLLTGNFSVYGSLEDTMRMVYGREAVLLFNSGFHANTGILPALADKRDLIIADKLVHASIIDGIRLSEAPFRRFKHNDYEDLERMIVSAANDAERIFVVTESVFSMDGDTADLRRLVELKRKYSNLFLYVDEAHAVGVRGDRGLGLAEELGCLSDIDVIVGTFGKALASMGAYVVCDGVVKEYLVNTMRPLIFSTALPPIQVAWTKFVFERLETFSDERKHLAYISELIRKAARGKVSESHIIPFVVGENEAAIEAARTFQKQGYYVLPVRPPTVPKGTSRLRFSLTADISVAEATEIANLISGINI
jgi:8-amino-7-oxononanoate synthase